MTKTNEAFKRNSLPTVIKQKEQQTSFSSLSSKLQGVLKKPIAHFMSNDINRDIRCTHIHITPTKT